MAEFKLGRLRFVWKGTWTTGTAYVKDDIIKYGGTAYVCVAGHTANASFNVDVVANRWVVMNSGQAWVSNPWGTSTQYKLNDLVKYGGNVYICTLNHTSSATANGGFYTDNTAGNWDLFVPGTDWKGTWQPENYYKENDLVKYNGRTYICLNAHSSAAGSYGGESITAIIINNAGFGSGYTNGASITISAPDLPGGVQATATITTSFGGVIQSINLTNPGSGYTAVPTTVAPGGTGSILTALITESFVNGLEDNQSDWQVFSDGFAFRGEWNGDEVPGNRVATAYAVNDVIKFGGSLYICTVPHTSNSSAFEDMYWDIFTKGFEYQSTWSGSTEYQLGDVVKYGGYVYVAKQRHTAQIPPLAPSFWDLLTQGFNNRERYDLLQSYKVGDVVQYGGNVYQAQAEVIAGETPYSAAAHWEKLIDGFRWLNEWTETPVEDNYKIGDVVKYRASTYIVTAEHVPSDEATTTTATATTTATNIVTVGSSSLLNLLQAVTFSGTGFGSLTNGVTYYVKEIVNATQIKISATKGGAVKALTTATGTMTVTFSSRPDLDDGTFFNSFAEGDANNVLIRRGDIVTRNAIQNVRLPKGAPGTFLKVGERDLEWNLVGELNRIFYVSLEGSDSNDGKTFDSSWRTIKHACNFVLNSGLNTRATPVVINVKTGVYTEVFPISVPKYTSLVGDELRMSVIEPTPATSGSDKFYMRDSTTMRNFTVRGATGANLANGTTATFTEANQYGTQRPTGGAWVSLDPGTGPNDESVWVGERSPYIQNVTLFGDYCVGQKIDGSLHNGGNKSITSNDFTTILSNGIGAWCTNQGRGELVSVFAYYSYMGYLCENGGVIRATNGNNSYGTYGSVSEGVDPTEISRTSNVDNRRFEALVDRVQTDGADEILYVEYLNAGETYTTATYGFEGSGTIGTITATAQPVDGGVCEVQVLTSGDNYSSVVNNAQAGTNIDIRLGAADIALTNAYVGERIILTDGVGSGQYAYITSFDGGSKLATLGMESFTPLTVTSVTTSTNLLNVISTATLSVDMPFTLTGTEFGTLTTATQYYVKAITANATIASVSIASFAGQLTVTSGNYLVGQSLTISGTFGGTGSITGYSNPTTYYIMVGGTSTTSIQITDTYENAIAGVATLTTSAGTPTGLTYTLGGTTFTAYTNTDTKTAITFPVTISGSMLLHKSGWDTVVNGITETISGITKANPAQITTTVPHAIFDGMQVTISGITGMTELNGNIYYATKTGASTFTLYQDSGLLTTVNSTAFGTYVSGGTVVGKKYVPEFLNTTSRYVIEPRVVVSTGTNAVATAVQTLGIDQITVSNGGTGFTVPPTVVINGDGTNTGGFGAQATASIAGSVDEVIVVTRGTGYTSAPTLTFVGGGLANGSANHATATATVSQTIKTVSVTAGGTGFTTPPSVIATGTGGSGAIISAQISNVVGTVNIVDDGASYTSPPSVAFIGGEPIEFAQGTAVLSAIVASITVQEGGSGYAPGSTIITLISGDTPDVVATAEAVIDFGNYSAGVTPGVITSITVLTSGSGYPTPPVVSIAGVGSNASATANISGVVESITITNPGRGYQTTPTVSFSGGGGSGVSGTASLTGSVISLTVADGGYGWTSTPTLSFTGGGGTSATATVTAMDTVLDTITITDSGSQYTSNPAISVSGGGGTGIVLRSRIDGVVTSVTVTDPGGSFATSPLITFVDGNQLKGVVIGKQYYRTSREFLGVTVAQQTQALASINQLRVVARAVAQNTAPSTVYQSAISRIAGTAGPAGIQNAVDVLVNSVYYTVENGRSYENSPAVLELNRTFLRAEAMAFWSANYPGIASAVWSRDVGLMVDAIVDDLSGFGVGYTLVAGIKSVFLGTARTTNLAAATDGIDYVRELALDIIQNVVIPNPLTGITITQTAVSTNLLTTTSTSDLSLNDRIIFVGTTFGGIQENTTYYVKEIVNGTTFKISNTLGGAERDLTSASGSMTLSKQAVDDELVLETGALTAVANLFNYTKSVISTTVANSSTFAAVATLINNNKNYIKAEVVAFISSTYLDFDFDQALCARDVGYIVDALVYDLVNAVDSNPTTSSTTTGVVSGITVVSGGTGYGLGTTVTLSGGSPVTPATASIIFNEQTGVIIGFTITNKGKGYSSAPRVGIIADAGTGALLRARIVGGSVDIITIINPGSGYSAGPNIQLIDTNNTEDGTFRVRVADGVLGQPRFTSRGVGYTTADALITGDGFADIAQVGQFVYINNLTNIPTPGANIQFANTPSSFYKLVTVREIQGPEGIIGARQLVTENKEFVQYEIINYLNNFTYDAVKCARDTVYIIEAVSDDFAYGGNSRLLAVIQRYQRNTYSMLDQQRIQTAYGLITLKQEINDLSGTPNPTLAEFADTIDVVIEWIKNGERNLALPAIVMPNGNFDVEDDRAKTVLLTNSGFIVEQTIAWMDLNSRIVGRDDTIFEREIREIVRTVAYDLTYTGNSQSVEYASSFFIDGELVIPGVPGTSAAAKADFLATIAFVSTLLQDVAINAIVSPIGGTTIAQNRSLPPGDTPGSTGRINTLITVIDDIIDVGLVASGVTKVGSNFTGFTTTTRTLVLAAKNTLATAVTNYIDDTFVDFTYDQAVCFRDTGLIVQALADDIFGDVAKSVEAGQRYYAATAALVLSEQKPQTLAAIEQINYIVQQVIRNNTYTRTQTNAFQTRFPTITTGAEASEHIGDTAYIIRDILENGTVYDAVKQLLLDNKTFIQAEVVAFVTASFENLDYNVALCSRDVGLIIDAIVYDIYGGLSRAREAGLRYYQSASALAAITGDQYAATVAAMNHLEDIIQSILANQDLTIKFQESLSRVSNSAIVDDVAQLLIDDKVTLCINTIIEIIDDGPSILPAGRYSARLQISPPLSILTAPDHDTSMVIRSRYSQVRLTGHDFLNIGTGSKNDTNYPGIPLNAPNANQELVENGGGRVFFTSTDQDGNFRVGELFKVEQSTGIATLNADAFNLSGLNELALGGVSLGGSGAVINEFSTDGTFFANSDRIVPTQKAIRTYIQSALGSGGGNIAVNAVTAGDVFITGRDIDTIGGLTLTLLPASGVLVNSNISSSSTATGALVVGGGVGIAGAVNIGGATVIDGALTITSTGAVKVASGTTAERPASASAGQFRFNTSVSRFEGYNGTAWTDVSGVNPWSIKNSAYTAVAGDRLMVNTSAGSVTITLPASPVLGDTIRIIDGAGTFDFNALTVNRNGQAIMSDNENLTVNTRNAAFTLVYYNATYGWRLGEA